MKRSLSALVLLGTLLASSASAKLPDRFGGWQTKTFRPISGSTLGHFAGPDGGVLREYGFVAGERREYAQNDATLTVTSWKMQDVSGSFGLFTFYRDPTMDSVEAEDRMAIGRDRVLVQRGLYVVEAQGAPLTLGEAGLLLAEVPPLRNSEDLLPPLPTYLPSEGLIADSPKFLMGPLTFARLEKSLPSSALDFAMGAEAALAQYRIDGRNLRLLLVSYPTPQLAAKKLRSFQELPAVSGKNGGSPVYIQRKGPLVCLVLDSPEFATAKKLLDRIQYESVVTWSEYAPSHRDNPGNLIWNVFLLAGFVLLFAFVAGISFGGVRLLAKKFVRVPIFDRPSQMEIIQLNLSDR